MQPDAQQCTKESSYPNSTGVYHTPPAHTPCGSILPVLPNSPTGETTLIPSNNLVESHLQQYLLGVAHTVETTPDTDMKSYTRNLQLH